MEEMTEHAAPMKKPAACAVCKKTFRFGQLAFKHTGDAGGAECENCLRRSAGKTAVTAQAVVFGGGVCSTVALDRARRNMKKLQRAARRGKKQAR